MVQILRVLLHDPVYNYWADLDCVLRSLPLINFLLWLVTALGCTLVQYRRLWLLNLLTEPQFEQLELDPVLPVD
jgi:hypothetical protein